MEHIRQSMQWQKDLFKALIEDNITNILLKNISEVAEKARVLGLQNGELIYDENSMKIINGYRGLIEERQKQIESHFNANKY